MDMENLFVWPGIHGELFSLEMLATMERYSKYFYHKI